MTKAKSEAGDAGGEIADQAQASGDSQPSPSDSPAVPPFDIATMVEGVVKHEGFLAAVRAAVAAEVGPKLDDEVLTTLVGLKVEALLPAALAKAAQDPAAAERDAEAEAAKARRQDDAAVAKAAAKRDEAERKARAKLKETAQERYQALLTGAPPSQIDLSVVTEAVLLLGDGSTFSIDFRRDIDVAALSLADSGPAIALASPPIDIGEGMPEAFRMTEVLLVLTGEEGFTAWACELVQPLMAGAGQTARFGENSLLFRPKRALAAAD